MLDEDMEQPHPYPREFAKQPADHLVGNQMKPPVPRGKFKRELMPGHC